MCVSLRLEVERALFGELLCGEPLRGELPRTTRRSVRSVSRRATAEPTVPKPRSATRVLATILLHLPSGDRSRRHAARDARFFPDPRQELAPKPRPTASRGCRGVVGPVPQPLWIKKCVFSCPVDYTTDIDVCK